METAGDRQLRFDFDAPPPPPAETPDDVTVRPSPGAQSVKPEPPWSLFRMRQAVLAELLRRAPSGIALKVSTRLKKFQVDAACCWSRPVNRLNRVIRTAVVDVYLTRERCLPECAERPLLLAEFKKLKFRRLELEAEIRRKEPELRDNEELFQEFQRFDYGRSANPEYRKLVRRLDKIHHALFRGSRMEQIRRADVADLLYMAVPEGLIAPDELIDGWGLWYVRKDGSVVEVRPAAEQPCSPASREHLALNVAAAALAPVLFANGVRPLKSGGIRLTRPPRPRRS